MEKFHVPSCCGKPCLGPDEEQRRTEETLWFFDLPVHFYREAWKFALTTTRHPFVRLESVSLCCMADTYTKILVSTL